MLPVGLFQEPKRWMLFIFAISLMVRIAFCGFVFPWLASDVNTSWRWEQGDGYDAIAKNLVEEGTYGFEPGVATALRLPIYPLFLAAIYRVAPRNFVVVSQIMQAIVSSVTVVLAFKLVCLMGCGMREGIVVSTLCAFYPNGILYTARAFSETLFTLFAVAFALCLVASLKDYRWRLTAVIAGICLGCSLLTRATFALLPFWLLGASVFLRPLRHIRVLTIILLITLATGVVMAPWVTRNYIRSHRFIPLTTGGYKATIMGLYVSEHYLSDKSIGYDIDATAQAKMEEQLAFLDPSPEDLSNSIVWETTQNYFMKKKWMDKLTTRPVYYSLVFIRNLLLTWFLSLHKWTTIMAMVMHLPLLLVFLVSLFTAEYNRRPDFMVMQLIIIYFTWFHAWIYPHVRLITPAIPFLLAVTIPFMLAHAERFLRRERGLKPGWR